MTTLPFDGIEILVFWSVLFHSIAFPDSCLMNIVIKKVWECSETVALLLQNGAEIDMQENKGWSSLMIASQNGHTETVAVLLQNGAEIDMQENTKMVHKLTCNRTMASLL